jgi:hypothetical protein
MRLKLLYPAWQTAAMSAALAPEDFDDLHEFIRVQVAAGFAPISDVVDEAVEVFADTTVAPNALRDAATTLAEQALATHLAEQVDWPAITDCDRIESAFAALDATGILARQHFSCCGACGANEIKDEIDQAKKDGRTIRGFTFFHIQDTEHAVGGESLFLSYGSVDGDRDEAVAVGNEIVEALRNEGLHPAWNGRHANRIGLPVAWQRRRTP